MTDARRPEPLDDEVLSAYLTGDLDDDAAAAVDEALGTDPGLGRRLDATARVLAVLRGVDEVEPPPGAGERLRRRLTAELDDAGGRVAGLGPADAVGQGADPPPTSGVTALASRRRLPWQAVAGVAAGLFAFALVGGGVLGGFGGFGGSEMAADAPEADMQLFADEQSDGTASRSADDAADADAGAGAGESAGTLGDAVEEAAPAPALPRTGPLPTVRDDAVDLGAEDGDLVERVTARYEGLAEAASLLGEAVPTAEEHAVRARAGVTAASLFRSGHAPDACLDAALAGPGPAVPVLVESAVLDDRPAVVYVVVGSTPGAGVLDDVELWVFTLPECAPAVAP